jgi:hypothetical protein
MDITTESLSDTAEVTAYRRQKLDEKADQSDEVFSKVAPNSCRK